MASIGVGSYLPTIVEVASAYEAALAQATVQATNADAPGKPQSPNLVAVYKEFIADLETPVSTFLKLRGYGPYAFLLESVEGGERLARYSFVGANPSDVLTVGDDPTCRFRGDPLVPLEAAMSSYRLLHVPSSKLPSFTGGAIGYVSYDAVRHFEPRTAAAVAAQTDVLGIPEAMFLLCNTLVVFDHVRHTIKIVSHARLPATDGALTLSAAQREELTASYDAACASIDAVFRTLSGPIPSPAIQTLPAASSVVPPSPIRPSPATAAATSSASSAAAATAASSPSASDFDWQRSSNVGKDGYEGMVCKLQEHIVDGDIIQAVPSQRITRTIPDGNPCTALDIYRQLRVVNPSPYMFYLELGPDFQIVGASPEMLVKVDAPTPPGSSGSSSSANGGSGGSASPRRPAAPAVVTAATAASPAVQLVSLPAAAVGPTIYTHPIAGTRRRGATPAEDDALAAELLADEKERAEHIMLVDLGRNDIGRVAAPGTVRVDSLMHIEKYSHVMHIVSNVSGSLAPGRSSFDAFRSIFPAGTVSGAPKIKAMELVATLEPEKRGVYAGAVGYVGYSGVMDTAIAIRTLVVRGKQVYLQAGAGIVYDSQPTSEYEETVSKLRATMRAVDAAIAAAADRHSA